MFGNIPFNWFNLPAKGSAGGILVVCDKFSITLSISIMFQEKKTGFIWKLVVVYGSPYEEGKDDFITELHSVMQSWHGPVLVAGDFNLIRFASSARINYRWTDAFNDWVHKWALIELSATNRKFTWTNN